MKVLLIDGGQSGQDGPRPIAAEAAGALRGAGAETELFGPVSTKDLVCSGCGACRGAGMCVYDPRGKDFLRAAADCGALFFLAPAGLFGLDVALKNLLTRAAALTPRPESGPLAGKPAAALILCRRGAGSGAARQMEELLRAAGLRPVGTACSALRGGDPGLPRALAALAQSLVLQNDHAVPG